MPASRSHPAAPDSRGPQSLRDLAASTGQTLRPATVAESGEEEIVIDTTDPLGPPDFRAADLGGRTSGEVVAELVPGAGARVTRLVEQVGRAVVDLGPSASGGRLQEFPGGPLPTLRPLLEP